MACCCQYTAFDFSDIKLLCVDEEEFLCIFAKGCLAAGEPVLGPGMIPPVEEKGEICNLGCGCCSYGLKKPSVCVKGRSHCLCIQSAKALPCDEEFVPAFVCAAYCLQCAPTCGCCKSPYSQEWLDAYETTQGGGGAPAIELTDDCVDAAKGDEMER
jgi:hypothetical protein